MNKIIYIFLTTYLFSIDFSSDISPIIYQNCTNCHRTGQIASFLPLTNYQEVYDNRYWIEYAISGPGSGRHGDPIMPPWPADRSYSTLIGEMYLTLDEINLFSNWIDTGGLQGNIEEEYTMPFFPEGSAIGQPDLVIQMNDPYTIYGDNEDNYRCFILETNNTNSIDLAALEFIPGNLEAVHHALIVAVPAGTADALDASSPEPGYECFGTFGVDNTSDLLGGYAPGLFVREWPEGLAQRIPANSDLILQIHYAPSNIVQTDQSSINIFYKEGNIDRYIKEYELVNFSFALAPNQITEVYSSFQVAQDISLIQFLPHSHLLGQSWEIFATTPSSQDTINIIRINDWDFDWQFFYSPEYMIYIPAGSVVHAYATYDNTTNNPNNPNNPPQWTYWGEGTGDEMFYVPFRYVDYQLGDENIYLGDIESINGDINDDGGLNVLDVVALINIVLSNQCSNNADLNADNGCNILDVVYLINLIL